MVSTAGLDNAHNAITSLTAWSARVRQPNVADVPRKTVSQEEWDYRKRLGRTIVTLRGMVEISQATLAERVDRSEAALSRWEGGKATPSAFDLRKIAETVARELIARVERGQTPGRLTEVTTIEAHLPALLLYPIAVPSADPMVEQIMAEVDRHLAAARQPHSEVVPTNSEADLATRVNPRLIREGARLGRSHVPEAPTKPARSPKRPVPSK